MVLSGDRAEILRLRARVVVLERAVFAALELALRIRPEELDAQLERARVSLDRSYQEPQFAPDVPDETERAFLASEAERLLRGLQADLGFAGGVPAQENG